MPVPKHRWSKARTRSRAAHFKLEAPALVPCPRCKQLKPAHQVCPNCGRYGDRQVIKVEEED